MRACDNKKKKNEALRINMNTHIPTLAVKVLILIRKD